LRAGDDSVFISPMVIAHASLVADDDVAPFRAVDQSEKPKTGVSHHTFPVLPHPT